MVHVKQQPSPSLRKTLCDALGPDLGKHVFPGGDPFKVKTDSVLAVLLIYYAHENDLSPIYQVFLLKV